MENSLSYVIFCWFVATTAHQRINFMVLVETKLVSNSVKVSDFSSQYSRRKSKKIRYRNYVRKRIIYAWLYDNLNATDPYLRKWFVPLQVVISHYFGYGILFIHFYKLIQRSGIHVVFYSFNFYKFSFKESESGKVT